VKQNNAAAEKWYEDGVRLHNPIAAFNVAYLLSAESEHAHDLAKAAQLFRISAAAGCVPAMSGLGQLLVEYPELAQSAQETQSILEAGSDEGSWKSSVLLAMVKRDGRSTSHDLQAARYYFELARLQGGAKAARLVNNDLLALSRELSAERVSAAVAQARAWFDAHPQADMISAVNPHPGTLAMLPPL
jgi:uncharacterized protein